MNAENQKDITTWRGLAGPFERLLGAQLSRSIDGRGRSEADIPPSRTDTRRSASATRGDLPSCLWPPTAAILA